VGGKEIELLVSRKGREDEGAKDLLLTLLFFVCFVSPYIALPEIFFLLPKEILVSSTNQPQKFSL